MLGSISGGHVPLDLKYDPVWEHEVRSVTTPLGGLLIMNDVLLVAVRSPRPFKGGGNLFLKLGAERRHELEIAFGLVTKSLVEILL